MRLWCQSESWIFNIWEAQICLKNHFISRFVTHLPLQLPPLTIKVTIKIKIHNHAPSLVRIFTKPLCSLWRSPGSCQKRAMFPKTQRRGWMFYKYFIPWYTIMTKHDFVTPKQKWRITSVQIYLTRKAYCVKWSKKGGAKRNFYVMQRLSKRLNAHKSSQNLHNIRLLWLYTGISVESLCVCGL